jgi:hypothetical protein
VGSILSALTNSVALDRNYRRHALKHGLDPGGKKQNSLRGFPIERARLEIGPPMFTAGTLAMIVYGWMLEFRACTSPARSSCRCCWATPLWQASIR